MLKRSLLFLSLATFLLFNFNIANSNEIIKNIEIYGNERISKDTIILFSKIEKNQNIKENKINEILKNLYDTNFFENITINFEDVLL